MALNRAAHISKQVGAYILLLVVLLGFFELLLRVEKKAVSSTDLSVQSPSGLTVMKPNLDTAYLSEENSLIHVHTNAEGFATLEYPVVAPSNTTRIAFLGNSFTKGFEVDNNKRFTDRAITRLQEENKAITYQGFNFGQSGYTLPEQFIVYRDYVQKYHPNLVVLVWYNGYDIPAMRQYQTLEGYITSTPLTQLNVNNLRSSAEEAAIASQTTRSKLATQSELIRLIITRVQNNPSLYALAVHLGLLHRPHTTEVANADSEVWRYLDITNVDYQKTLNFAARLINAFANAVTKDGSHFALVIIPSHWEIDSHYRSQIPLKLGDSNSLNTQIKEEITGRYPVLDLSTALRDQINSKKEPIFINGTGHFTSYAHQIVGELLPDFLKNALKQAK